VTSVDKRYICVKQPLAFRGATVVTSADKCYICVKQLLAFSLATLVTSVDKRLFHPDVEFIDRSHECRSTAG
jgi:hypothetical protein